MTTTIEEVRAVFGNTIQPGLDLVKAEPFCIDYETTLVNDGQVQTRMRITKLVCKETAIEFRVNGASRTLPTELAVLDKISLLVVSPPTSLRRVTVKRSPETIAKMRASASSGENSPRALVTNEVANQIRMCVAGGERQIDIARRLGLPPPTVCLIVNGKTYRSTPT